VRCYTCTAVDGYNCNEIKCTIAVYPTRSIAVEKLVMSCLVSVQGLVKAGVVGLAFAGQMLSG